MLFRGLEKVSQIDFKTWETDWRGVRVGSGRGRKTGTEGGGGWG